MTLTRLQLAELILEHFPDECPEAIEHLDAHRGVPGYEDAAIAGEGAEA